MSRFTTLRILCGLTAAALTLTVPAISRAQATYAITDLATPGGSTSVGNAINASGQVAGYTETVTNITTPPTTVQHAVVWTGATLTNLFTPSGADTFAFGINDSGQVAGYTFFSGTNHYAVRWTGTTLTNLGTLGGVGSYGYAINASGQVTGEADLTNQAGFDAARWTGATAADLGTIGGIIGFGQAINTSGQVAGYSFTTNDAAVHAVRGTGTALTDLGTLGGNNSYGQGINDSGQVAGYSYLADNQRTHAVLWTGTTITDLGTLGGTNSQAFGINSSGVVVGFSLLANGAQVAFVTVGNTMYDLNTLIPANSGWQLAQANAINANGQITGYGTIKGQQHAFVLTPVTATASGYLTLEGVASLNAVSPAAPLGTFHVSFRTPGTTREVYGANVTLTTTLHVTGGTYTVSNIPIGTYDVAIKGSKNLRVVVPGQVVSGTISLPDVTLPAGDGNNDNMVDTGDFNILAGAFGGVGSVSGSGYDPTADFNFDGKIDSSDFNLLIGEFGNAGAM